MVWILFESPAARFSIQSRPLIGRCYTAALNGRPPNSQSTINGGDLMKLDYSTQIFQRGKKIKENANMCVDNSRWNTFLSRDVFSYYHTQSFPLRVFVYLFVCLFVCLFVFSFVAEVHFPVEKLYCHGSGVSLLYSSVCNAHWLPLYSKRTGRNHWSTTMGVVHCVGLISAPVHLKWFEIITRFKHGI